MWDGQQCCGPGYTGYKPYPPIYYDPNWIPEPAPYYDPRHFSQPSNVQTWTEPMYGMACPSENYGNASVNFGFGPPTFNTPQYPMSPSFPHPHPDFAPLMAEPEICSPGNGCETNAILGQIDNLDYKIAKFSAMAEEEKLKDPEGAKTTRLIVKDLAEYRQFLAGFLPNAYSASSPQASSNGQPLPECSPESEGANLKIDSPPKGCSYEEFLGWLEGGNSGINPEVRPPYRIGIVLPRDPSHFYGPSHVRIMPEAKKEQRKVASNSSIKHEFGKNAGKQLVVDEQNSGEACFGEWFEMLTGTGFNSEYVEKGVQVQLQYAQAIKSENMEGMAMLDGSDGEKDAVGKWDNELATIGRIAELEMSEGHPETSEYFSPKLPSVPAYAVPSIPKGVQVSWSKRRLKISATLNRIRGYWKSGNGMKAQRIHWTKRRMKGPEWNFGHLDRKLGSQSRTIVVNCKGVGGRGLLVRDFDRELLSWLKTGNLDWKQISDGIWMDEWGIVDFVRARSGNRNRSNSMKFDPELLSWLKMPYGRGPTFPPLVNLIDSDVCNFIRKDYFLGFDGVGFVFPDSRSVLGTFKHALRAISKCSPPSPPRALPFGQPHTHFARRDVASQRGRM